MKILIIGGGGREHAIITALAKSPHNPTLYCAPGNAGIAQLATCLPIAATDLDAILNWATEHQPDWVFVAPDDPLAMGLVDKLEAVGISAFGPRQNAAIIESSKVFSKAFMQRHNIPTANYAAFDNETDALNYIKTQTVPIVVKDDGLALGKGVTIAQTQNEAADAVAAIFGGKPNRRVVIEEYMTGPEVTVLAFTDGKTVVPMPSSQDHKRAYDNDEGPNTGGMGAICPSPHYTPEIAELCAKTIFEPTIKGLAAENRPFKGVLYFGLMLTPDGPRVIEYNARFGDPEAQAVLPLLETDLVNICQATINETLADLPIQWQKKAAACVVLASGGYPGEYNKGVPITGFDQVTNATVYHAGTATKNNRIVTNGGRVLGVTAVADNLPEALANAYDALTPIKFEGMFRRNDIGRL